MSNELRAQLVASALEWQRRYSVAPSITSALSEYDAAILIGCTDSEYSAAMQDRTAVQRGFDFEHQGLRYQVKANRPSGKPGSFVTLVAKPKNYEWDLLIWVLYDKHYVLQEAWQWESDQFRQTLGDLKRLSPKHLRQGMRLA